MERRPCGGLRRATIRRLQIPRGREALLRQLAARKGDSAGHRHSAADDASGQVTLAIAQGLAKLLDALPQRGTLSEWAQAWQRLAQETGLLRAMDVGNGKVDRPAEAERSTVNLSPFLSDRPAWDRLMEVLAADDTLAAWLKQPAAPLDRPAAVETLLDILRSERVGHAGDESGYVRVLSASSIRSLRIPHLFLAGLSEKVFPQAQRDDRLYSDAEYGRIDRRRLAVCGAANARTRRCCCSTRRSPGPINGCI